MERLAGLILAKLAQRRHHGDWREQSTRDLMEHLRDEYREMRDMWFQADRVPDLIAELTDVAAMCALLIDRLEQP